MTHRLQNHPVRCSPARCSIPVEPPLYSGMSENFKKAIHDAASRAEQRRVLGIMRKTPGALGEPPRILDVIEANTVYVRRAEIEQRIEREVLRKGKDLHKADPGEMRHAVEKWVEAQTLVRKLSQEP